MPHLFKMMVAALLFLGGNATTGLADGELPSLLSAADKARLARFDDVRAAAIAEAKAGAPAAYAATLERILAGEALPLNGQFNAEGQWRCRVIKLGGLLPLVIYDWFSCRIVGDGAGWRLEKLTGSQRTSGRLYTESDTRLVYVGAGHFADEKPRSYGADPQQDQVAYVVRPESQRLRFEFPLPQFESHFDILELER